MYGKKRDDDAKKKSVDFFPKAFRAAKSILLFYRIFSAIYNIKNDFCINGCINKNFVLFFLN